MYMTIEALADGGVMAGLTRELATTMAAQTMLVRKVCFNKCACLLLFNCTIGCCKNGVGQSQNTSWRGKLEYPCVLIVYICSQVTMD